MEPGSSHILACVRQEALLPGDPTLAMERLLELEVAGDLPPLLCFWGHTAKADHPGPWVLSQWWPARFHVEGQTYRHAEAFMMAEKARLFGDEETRQLVLLAAHPGEAKKLGRSVRGFDDETWTAARYDVVLRASVAKFGQNEALGSYLRSTGPAVLVEASPPDRIWGIGLGAGDEGARTPSQWRGLNLLGFALTHARKLLAVG
jgi:ribA/ribD-fused uncharacterized protein